jgi:hypothetical protein
VERELQAPGLLAPLGQEQRLALGLPLERRARLALDWELQERLVRQELVRG